MMLYLDAINELAGTSKLIFLLLSVQTHILVLFFLVFGEDRNKKFEVATIQLEIDKLVDELAHLLAVSFHNLIYLEVLHIGQSKFLEVRQHFLDSLIQLSFVVFEVNEDSTLLLALNTDKMSKKSKKIDG